MERRVQEWSHAQELELKSWIELSDPSQGHRWREYISSCIPHIEGHALDIGSRPDSILFHISGGELKVALDPLIDKYQTLKNVKKGEGVCFVKAVGENFLFKEGSFSSVFSMNSIDHGFSPEKIVNETWRVLEQGGSAYVEIFCYPVLDKIMFNIGHRDPLFSYHPNKMTPRDVLHLFSVPGFDLAFSRISSFHTIKKPGDVIKRVKINPFHFFIRAADHALYKLAPGFFGKHIFLIVKKPMNPDRERAPRWRKSA